MNEADLILGVPEAPAVKLAQLNITYNGQQGNLPDLVPFDMTDADVKRVATEAISNGIPGITADPNVDLKDFVVDRFPERPDVPVNRLSMRPKTPFGK